MEKDIHEPLVYSPDEVRKLLGISRGLMYQALNTGEIPSIRIGRRILIPRVALDRLLNEGTDGNIRKKNQPES